MSNITAYLPKIPSHLLKPEESIVKQLKVWCDEVLSTDEPIERLPAVHLDRMSIYLDSVLHTKISKLAKTIDESDGRAFGACIYTAIRRAEAKQKNEAGEDKPVLDELDSLLPPGLRWQEKQKDLVRAIQGCIEQNKVGMIEGSTGIGKSLALLMSARWALEKSPKNGPVVVATPTAALIAQMSKEWNRVDPEKKYKAAILLGSAQFVSPSEIEGFLKDSSLTSLPSLRDWVAQGGPPVTEQSKLFAEYHPDLRWLVDDFKLVAGLDSNGSSEAISYEDFLLDSNDKTLAEAEHYRSLREAALQADIVFCTHAMLGVDALLSGCEKNPVSILPDYKTVLIDEAHALEQWVANAIGAGVSLFRLAGEIRKMKTLKNRKEIAEMIQVLIGACRELEDNTVYKPWLDDQPKAFELIIDTADVLRKKLRELPKRSWRIDEAVQVFEGLVKQNKRVHFRFSEIKRYPTIVAGEKSVDFLLKRIWKRAASAVNLSASLYLYTDSGASSAYMQDLLAIPHDRVKTHVPLATKWLTQIPTLYTPSDPIPLTPPTKPKGMRDDDYLAAKHRWHTAIAQNIAHVARDAKGGVLVLMTSYQSIRHVAKLLWGAGLCGRLVIQSEKIGFAACRDEFVSLQGRGIRPIWLATGSAWTGLDLFDQTQLEHPENDYLLTDLIIPRVPFGMNRTSTHYSRAKYYSSHERNETLLLFKQGLGRLMRRDKVRHRRIWVLDGRIFNRSSRGYDKYKAFRDLLSRYSNQARIEYIARDAA